MFFRYNMGKNKKVRCNIYRLRKINIPTQWRVCYLVKQDVGTVTKQFGAFCV